LCSSQAPDATLVNLGQSGSSRHTETNLPKCYGSGLISCALDAADAGAGHDRPEDFEIEIEVDVVDYIFPI